MSATNADVTITYEKSVSLPACVLRQADIEQVIERVTAGVDASDVALFLGVETRLHEQAIRAHTVAGLYRAGLPDKLSNLTLTLTLRDRRVRLAFRPIGTHLFVSGGDPTWVEGTAVRVAACARAKKARLSLLYRRDVLSTLLGLTALLLIVPFLRLLIIGHSPPAIDLLPGYALMALMVIVVTFTPSPVVARARGRRIRDSIVRNTIALVIVLGSALALLVVKNDAATVATTVLALATFLTAVVQTLVAIYKD